MIINIAQQQYTFVSYILGYVDLILDTAFIAAFVGVCIIGVMSLITRYKDTEVSPIFVDIKTKLGNIFYGLLVVSSLYQIASFLVNLYIKTVKG